MLDHVNKVKLLADQLVCLKVHVRDEDIIMILLKNLPTSFEYLITFMEMMLMKELMMDYMTTHLMDDMSQHKKKKPHDGVATRQRGQLIFVPMCNIILLLCKTGSYYAFFLQRKKIQMTMITIHFLYVMKHIPKTYENGSWIWMPLSI